METLQNFVAFSEYMNFNFETSSVSTGSYRVQGAGLSTKPPSGYPSPPFETTSFIDGLRKFVGYDFKISNLLMFACSINGLLSE